MNLDIKPLSADRMDDFLAFFDDEAFADNPDWAGCYCQFYHYAAGDPRWDEAGADANRSLAREGILGGRMRGYLAYADGKAAGWCCAGPKAGYLRLMSDERLCSGDDTHTFSIVCYVVAAPFRRQGIARALLRHACADARKQRYAYAEAYPQHLEESDASHYHGPQSLYEGEGFRVHKELGTSCIMRLDLA